MSIHLDNGKGLPLCGMVSGRGNVLAVTPDTGTANCQRCFKSVERLERDAEARCFEWENGVRVWMPAGKMEFGVGVVYRVCKMTVYVKWANGDKGSWRKARLEVVK